MTTSRPLDPLRSTPPLRGAMAHERYAPSVTPRLEQQRRWVDRRLAAAPRWCSVDLRDGNQALVHPMDSERKLALFRLLVSLGFKEIEVGFPASSSSDYRFIRRLIEEDLVPRDVTLQVLAPCREDLLVRTFECLSGAQRAIIHFYNPTSELQQRLVLGLSATQCLEQATHGARLCRSFALAASGDIYFEYSPESYTASDPHFVYDICAAVTDELSASPEHPVIINLPATVEVYDPAAYADGVEWFVDLVDLERVIVSLHPHNDRGTAVAAAEFGLRAGASRLEGTLLGNGERTGNVDLVTVALNLMSQGVDPELDLRDVDEIVRVCEYVTQIPTSPRHPYVGSLVYTAFSGAHQDAISKVLHAGGLENRWEVPYLPIDPRDVGRNYDAVVRVNSQSGKGGLAWVLHHEFGLDLPRELRSDFAPVVQAFCEDVGEASGAQILDLFLRTYVRDDHPLAFISSEVVSQHDGQCELTCRVRINGVDRVVVGRGAGVVEALCDALARELGIDLAVRSYSEHALSELTESAAVAYVLVEDRRVDEWETVWGVGTDRSMLVACLKAVLAALNRTKWHEAPVVLSAG